MPLRLVTVDDIRANPELSKRGISVNQMHDFPDDESVHAIEPTDPPVVQEDVEANKVKPLHIPQHHIEQKEDKPSQQEVKKELPKVKATKTEVAKESKKSIIPEPKKTETKKVVAQEAKKSETKKAEPQKTVVPDKSVRKNNPRRK